MLCSLYYFPPNLLRNATFCVLLLQDPDACYYLGVCYENGYGMPMPDDSMALTFYCKAALAGQSDAQYNLGVFYEEGFGTAYCSPPL